MSSVDNHNLSEAVIPSEHHHHDNHHPGLLVMPTSPLSVTTASMSASDDMIENENEMLRDRVCALEKRVHDQNDEITCLRATLADCLRRINGLELNKSHVCDEMSLMGCRRLQQDAQCLVHIPRMILTAPLGPHMKQLIGEHHMHQIETNLGLKPIC